MLYTPAGGWAISIHAPRGGSDTVIVLTDTDDNDFNPRSPWGERRQKRRQRTNHHCISIHAPRGGSDFVIASRLLNIGDFNPRSPWGERRKAELKRSAKVDFNPRSPWGERQTQIYNQDKFKTFQSTLPVGGATGQRGKGSIIVIISIHAPRGGSDPSSSAARSGGRGFQSTLPVGGATCYCQQAAEHW